MENIQYRGVGDLKNEEKDTLNKLAPERNEDFTGSVWRMKRIAFPIHNIIKQLQKSTLLRLYHPSRINRMHDNMLKYDEPIDKFGYNELFGILTNELWSEVNDRESINSFRRELQSYHIKILTIVPLSFKNQLLIL